jgi:hypothetical protein
MRFAFGLQWVSSKLRPSFNRILIASEGAKRCRLLATQMTRLAGRLMTTRKASFSKGECHPLMKARFSKDPSCRNSCTDFQARSESKCRAEMMPRRFFCRMFWSPTHQSLDGFESAPCGDRISWTSHPAITKFSMAVIASAVYAFNLLRSVVTLPRSICRTQARNFQMHRQVHRSQPAPTFAAFGHRLVIAPFY